MNERDEDFTHDNYNPYMDDALDDVLDVVGGPGGWDVYPIFIYGDHFSSTGYTAMPAPQLAEIRAARKTASAAAKLARKPG
jgi:hypothetical protein